MRSFLMMLLLAVAFEGGLLAQGGTPIEQGKDEKAVSAAVESLRKAMIDPNKDALLKLSMPQLTYGHSDGNIQNQAEFVDALVSGKSDFVTIELTEQKISVVDKAATVRHILTATTNNGGQPGQTKLSVLLVWLKDKGEWRLLARQAVKVVPAP